MRTRIRKTSLIFGIEIGDNMEAKTRKRMCLNCRHRIVEGASSFCIYNGKRFLHYVEVFDGWCIHWSKERDMKTYPNVVCVKLDEHELKNNNRRSK